MSAIATASRTKRPPTIRTSWCAGGYADPGPSSGSTFGTLDNRWFLNGGNDPPYWRRTMALGWAVISTGLHVDHKIAPAINATPDAELVATYSRDQGRA